MDPLKIYCLYFQTWRYSTFFGDSMFVFKGCQGLVTNPGALFLEVVVALRGEGTNDWSSTWTNLHKDHPALCLWKTNLPEPMANLTNLLGVTYLVSEK